MLLQQKGPWQAKQRALWQRPLRIAAGSPRAARRGSPCFPRLEKARAHQQRPSPTKETNKPKKQRTSFSSLPVPWSVGHQWGASGLPRTEKTPCPVKREAEKRILSTKTASSHGYTSCKPPVHLARPSRQLRGGHPDHLLFTHGHLWPKGCVSSPRSQHLSSEGGCNWTPNGFLGKQEAAPATSAHSPLLPLLLPALSLKASGRRRPTEVTA